MKINMTKLNEDNEPQGFTTQRRTLKKESILQFGNHSKTRQKYIAAAQKAIRDEDLGVVHYTESGKPEHVVKLCKNAKCAKQNRLKEIEKEELEADKIYSVGIAMRFGFTRQKENRVNTQEITEEYADKLGIQL